MEIPNNYLNQKVIVLLKGEEISIRGYISEINKEYIILRDEENTGNYSNEIGTFIPVDSILIIKPNRMDSDEISF